MTATPPSARARLAQPLQIALLTLTWLVPAAGADSPSAAALIAEAERSMTDGDYRAGVAGYVDAALAGDSVETARQATLTAHRFGFNAAAIEAADRWLALDPNGWQADVYAATAALRAGDTRAATERLVRRLKAQQSADGGIATIEDSCELMRELSQGIRPEDAQRVLDTLAKQFKSTPCVIQLAASSALGNEAYRDAERHLKRLRKLDAFDDQARLTEMARLIATDDIDAALSRDELRLSDAATVEQRIESAFLHVRAEQTETALNMLSLLQTEHPDDAEVMEALAIAQLQSGDAQAARRGFLDLLASGERTSNALYYLARFAESDRRGEQAIRLYSQVEEGDFAAAAQQRAATLLRQRDGVPAAITHIDEFIVRHPRFGLVLSTSLAALYAEGEFYDQALERYDEYLALNPRSEFVLLARADVLLKMGRLDDSIAAFRDVVELYPESASALNALGYTLADRTDKLREAERLIDKALELSPDNAAIIDSKGWVLFRRGKIGEAREYLERAWSEFPDPEVAAHLGEALWRLGEEDEARALLEEAWQRFPGDKLLRDTIRRLLEDGPSTRS